MPPLEMWRSLENQSHYLMKLQESQSTQDFLIISNRDLRLTFYYLLYLLIRIYFSLFLSLHMGKRRVLFCSQKETNPNTMRQCEIFER